MSLQIGLIVLLHVSGLVSSTPHTEEGLLDVMLASSNDGSLCQLMNECLTIHPIKIRLALTDGITGTRAGTLGWSVQGEDSLCWGDDAQGSWVWGHVTHHNRSPRTRTHGALDTLTS